MTIQLIMKNGTGYLIRDEEAGTLGEFKAKLKRADRIKVKLVNNTEIGISKYDVKYLIRLSK